MACLDIMYNQNSSDHKGFGTPMSPRISFSNDFVESSRSNSISHSSQLHQMMKNDRVYRDAPVSSDFEFNVTNYSMMSADQLFSKGRLLPLKESCSHKTTTLRDELLHEDKDDFSLRPPKSSTRWKGLLRLKKSHIGSRNVDKNNEGNVEKRSNGGHGSKNSQEPYNGAGGGSSSRDEEFRFN
ncbi:uncharacterized protein LOC132048011 [Lycium ferocissimum]|uniref:uncharacterized protein LOC132048011 n=1 Tax=Lycium ferocissimum TaxID=112874 RepID=UPI002816355A|nr:uncharacterized protein LOC132048011 [Lycium ferocissimum]